MKKMIWTILLTGCSVSGFSQVLLEDKQGDQIANNSPIFAHAAGASINTSLIKLNTGDQSLGFNYITSTKITDPSNYQIFEYSIKAKSTDGAANVFSSGQFSPGVKLSYSFTQVTLLANKTNFVDWGGINIGYAIDKYSLYKRDTTFANQLYSKGFKGLTVTFNYNALINTKWILNARMGYARKNNYDDLTSVNIQDIASVTDPATLVMRQTTKSKTAKEGAFVENDSWPMIIALTKATATDVGAAAAQLRIGYTVYLKNIVSTGKPKTNAGILFFLTKQDKSGVRAPVFGLDIQASDPFDVNHVNNGLQNRLAVGFTTVFTL